MGSLLSIKSIILSYCSMLAAEIVQQDSPLSASSFFELIFDFYIHLMLDNFEDGQLDTFKENVQKFLDAGINCLSGSYNLVFIVIKTAISTKLQILQCTFEHLLWLQYKEEGECPSGFSVGDWSDGSGECCCDPGYQPEHPDSM